MASLQSTISFKSRKRTYFNECKEKTNNENKDTLNIDKRTTLKRGLKEKDSDVISEEDKSLSKKIRKAKDNLSTFCDESVNTDKGNICAPTKPLEPLVSREKEIEYIQNFLIEHLDKEQSASLYISGQPGTGKTASLSYILQVPKIRDGYKQVYINCTMMKSAASIYSRICKELQLPTSGTSEKVCLNTIENYLIKKHKMM
ncbi:unnamed protein product [Euphydryas editha]|uniref:ORC1/DEAH AAA+ ATPase domain-containing protein n=1 Tax=Euphydryas editha TaxID=104508 RepID=A0AAU9VAD7_EUPED|nr:unnamed protein product [Euphydryas editha]